MSRGQTTTRRSTRDSQGRSVPVPGVPCVPSSSSAEAHGAGSGSSTAAGEPDTLQSTSSSVDSTEDDWLPAKNACTHSADGAGPWPATGSLPAPLVTTAHVGPQSWVTSMQSSWASERASPSCADQRGRRLEGVEAGSWSASAAGRTSSTSTPSTWSTSLDQQRHEPVVGQLDHELVDGPAGAPLEDVDADHVAAHRADAAGDLRRGRPGGRAATPARSRCSPWRAMADGPYGRRGERRVSHVCRPSEKADAARS